MVTAPASRELGFWMQRKGIAERHGLQIVRVSEGLLRYAPRQDRNQGIRLGIDSRDRRRGEMEGTPHIISHQPVMGTGSVPARQGLIEDLMDFGLRVPPRVGIALAAMSWMVFHVISAQTAPVAGKFGGGNLSAALQTLFYFGALLFQFAIPFCLLVGVTVSVIKQRRARKVFAQALVNPKVALSDMSWRDFERLIGETFRQQGFTVDERGGATPDGGVDLVLKKDGKLYLVQCKHWKAWQVGVSVVRELNGVISAQKADGGYVVTGGSFTKDAYAFADSCAIKLIDGLKLQTLMQTRPAPAEIQRKDVAQEIPDCPDCGAAMREKVASKGPYKGQPFWSCSTYPKCRRIVHIERVA